jgi:hypothetical protein
LNSCLKSDWIKVRDLSFVEDEIIAAIEHFIPSIPVFLYELDQKALGISSSKAAVAEAKRAGTFGVKSVQKKESTRPISPAITKPSIVTIPEPTLISTEVKANEIPSNLNRTNLAKLEQKRVESLEKQRQAVQAKYTTKTEDLPFLAPRTSVYTTKFDNLKKEMEESRQSELAFDSSFVNIPPDFSKIPAAIKINKAAVLREDFLFRKQQEHDAKLIKQYEEELRDASEFYQWQSEMKENDDQEKLKLVQFRRDQARQAAIDARNAMAKHADDNKAIGDLIREQEDIIKHKVEIERQLEVLHNRMVANAIAEKRDLNPKLATNAVLSRKVEEGKKLREELEEARIKKEKEDQIEQEELTDKIRQQKAINSVHKKFIKVFDPTESSGLGFLDEMSYLEMKERLESEKLRYEALELNKRQEILAAKEKSSKDLEARALNIQRMREKRAEATRQYYIEKEQIEREKKEKEEKLRQESAAILAKQLESKREQKIEQREKLLAEEERIKRQQQYLGAALGAVEETKYGELLLAKERRDKNLQETAKQKAMLTEKSKSSELTNRLFVRKQDSITAARRIMESEREALDQKKVALIRLRDEYEDKKAAVTKGRLQHERTMAVTKSFNPYGTRITADIQEQSRRFKGKI